MASTAATATSHADGLLREFAKIIQFREEILSGSHPRIKLPAHSAKQSNVNVFRPGQNGVADRVTTAPSASTSQHTTQQTQKNGVNGHKISNMSSFQANSQHPAPTAGTQAKAVPEIDPVLLEKSDDLKNAEIRLQRQRIEVELKQEVEQRRGKLQSLDEMPDFDLSDVLIKALARVQAAALPALADKNNNNTAAATNASPSSDSVDDNTFYSSQHDTPESSKSGRQHHPDNEDVQMLDDSNYEPHIFDKPVPPIPTIPQGSATQRPSGLRQFTMSGALIPQVAQIPQQAIEVRSSQESGEASGSRDTNSNGTDHNADRQNLGRRGLQPAFEPQEPRLVRSVDLSPVAPQPSHISTLAVSRRQPVPDRGGRMPQGTPAQVAALRGEASGPNTSPESSPQTGTTKSDRKKNKKRKKKADRQVPEPLSPYIKPEPRSPSPVSAPAYSRPNKRQRQSGGSRQIPVQDLTFDEPRYEQVQPAQSERFPSRQYRDGRYTVAYEDPRRPTAPIVQSPRFERGLFEERRASTQVRQPRSPGSTFVQYAEPPPQRTASQAGQAYYREVPHDEPRINARSEVVRERSLSPGMGPPRSTRIIVDQYGREYYEPARPAAIRQSVAPTSRHSDPEVIYERALPREASRRPDAFDDGGVVYARRASPTYAVPRRVITQPEYAPQAEYRSYRQREYSARPAGAPEEFVMRAPVERRFEETPREFVTRATSVRPAAEPVRYEMARDYGRVQSVRPDMQLREHLPGGPPDGRRSVIQQPVAREYTSHSAEQQVIRQEYIRPAEERYYERPGRSGEEIAFIERPRGATQEIVYADDARREVYR
ncbi:hypothetical protein MKZ38_005922 [Zalerion maritima]|uniref:Uncharacterized protein n=1 Tax=Zalerion maritima TaxID=339359 RepID=A0AAD5RK38_9PEZI|nr:hypothetical protein MKZ38_005922 [Zalerion maritima]